MKKLPLISLMALGAVAWLRAGETLPPISSPTLDEATRNKILFISEGGEPHTLDSQAVQSIPEDHIIMGLIEGLVGCHSTDQSKEVPGMADRWEHNDDYSIWTFHIGKDRKWSNGDPVTAQDFVFSYKRVLSMRSKGLAVPLWHWSGVRYSTTFRKSFQESQSDRVVPDLLRTIIIIGSK